MPAPKQKPPGFYAEALREHGTQRAAATALNINLAAFQNGCRRENKRAEKMQAERGAALQFPTFSKKHVSTQELIDRLAHESDLKDQRAKEEKWFNVHVHDNKPIGVMWVGDPHLGVSTKWARLRKDVAHLASVPGLYGVNIGDTTDNWVGSLMRIFAEQDISNRSARQLAQWFLGEAGITWLAWLFGNHDEWNDGSDILRLMNIHNRVPMLDWIARFQICFPNGSTVRVRASHDMPGHSMWNPTHGPARAGRMLGDRADLYVAGHKHTWGTQHMEMPEADLCPVAIRVRGYKVHDPHARRLGYPEDQYGCSILTIIDPTVEGPGRVTAFVDTDQGVKVLQALRGDVSSPSTRLRNVSTKSKNGDMSAKRPRSKKAGKKARKVRK